MKPWLWNFDIDRYVDSLVPSPPWLYLPRPVSWFLGHRREDDEPPEMGNLEPIAWAFAGVFSSILLIEGVGKRIAAFEAHSAPLMVGSFGAMAVLEFYAIDSPLAQPRGAVFGNLIASFLGVCVQKLFLMGDDFEGTRWVGGALACAAATSAMALTGTVHPPAGAAALLAVLDDDVLRLGWWYLPLVMLGVSLMLSVAVVVNNIRRRFPLYWWTAGSLRVPDDGKPSQQEARGREEGEGEEKEGGGEQEREREQQEGRRGEGEREDVESRASAHQLSLMHGKDGEIVIRPGFVSLPRHLVLEEGERAFLESLRYRL
ncbi:HPP family [Geosmithia morbida]|uniref:HPP family n=1 Tax=Geosmithia morbida TaxID=1094350 RepID=A0A9P4Z1I4_9HYPO|nr:HPP family [Geosmithia morbida]KAF4126983.1 HPP family [Geosmithia morbida]